MDISKTKDLIVKLAQDGMATQSRSADIQGALDTQAVEISKNEVGIATAPAPVLSFTIPFVFIERLHRGDREAGGEAQRACG
jgi:hypothetical protein